MTDAVIDLFAGPGGWSTGLNMLGRAETVGIELDEAACATARAAGHERLRRDIAQMDPHSIFSLYQYGSRCEGLIASPPCPGFSAAGLGLGKKDLEMILTVIRDVGAGAAIDPLLASLRLAQHDERSALTLEPLRWALALQPTWLAWEQVPAVLPLWEACAALLRERGWYVWTGKVHAEQYGVPQARTRAVLLAHREREVDRPTPTHAMYHRQAPHKRGDLPMWRTMADAFGAGWTPTAANPGTTWADMDWCWTRPSPTIVGTFCPDVVAAPGYRKAGDGPRQNARGSIRIALDEASILQSFPRGYPWNGGPRDAEGRKWQQVGDAVPPLLAAHVLAELGVGEPPR